jgi:hypothetical protein
MVVIVRHGRSGIEFAGSGTELAVTGAWVHLTGD